MGGSRGGSHRERPGFDFTVDRDTDARIARCKDTATLRVWLVRAVSARALDDVFAP